MTVESVIDSLVMSKEATCAQEMLIYVGDSYSKDLGENANTCIQIRTLYRLYTRDRLYSCAETAYMIC